MKIRTRVQNTLQAMALNHALRRGRGLWTATGQKALQALSLAGYTRQRRDELLRSYVQLQQRIQELDGQVEKQVQPIGPGDSKDLPTPGLIAFDHPVWSDDGRQVVYCEG